MKNLTLSELNVGDEVWCDCIPGLPSFGDSLSRNKIYKISVEYDHLTGEKYNIIWLNEDRNFDSRTGDAINSPIGYYIEPIQK
jgi:hypothetical protein